MNNAMTKIRQLDKIAQNKMEKSKFYAGLVHRMCDANKKKRKNERE